MKINPFEHIHKPMPAVSHNLKPGADGRAFSDALGRALETGTAASAQAGPAAPGPASISGVQFSSLPFAVPASTAEKVDRLLDLLDGYRQQLADHRQSLKSIAPQLERVEKGMRELEKSIESLDDADSLKAISQEALITATAEVFKFNRGDYNPS